MALLISELMDKYPILDIDNRQGMTDYIDFIRFEEVSEPIMVGKDIHDRFFMVLKIEIDYEFYLQTIFQRRFCHNNNLENMLVMACGHATPNVIESCGGFVPEQYQLIKDLLAHKEIILEEKHHPATIDLYGKKIKILDKRRIESAITIQRAWRKCRYDPDYKMCETVLLRSLKDIGCKF